MNASTALIPVIAGALQDQPVQLCNARDLHAFLEVGRDFSNWIKDRIEQYGFIDGEDYSPNLARIPGKRGQPRTDYHLTLDMAKELAMVENNEKGRQVRRYFIALERKAHTAPALPHLIAPAQQNALQQIVARRAGESGGIRAYMWSRFNNHFAPGSYKQLPATRFDEAVAYLEAMPMKGDAPAMPAPESDPAAQAALDVLCRPGVRVVFHFGRETDGRAIAMACTIPEGSNTATPEQFVRDVADPGSFFPRALLPSLIAAAAKRLQS